MLLIRKTKLILPSGRKDRRLCSLRLRSFGKGSLINFRCSQIERNHIFAICVNQPAKQFVSIVKKT